MGLPPSNVVRQSVVDVSPPLSCVVSEVNYGGGELMVTVDCIKDGFPDGWTPEERRFYLDTLAMVCFKRKNFSPHPAAGTADFAKC